MKIHGLQKMTLLDYPGKVACTVFLGGCDLRCPFCHNAELIDGSAKAVMEDDELLQFLQRRKGLLEGVAITGGEPTLRQDLPGFLGAIKALGYPVKLDTNGMHPEVLKKMLDENLVDYVAMDIKNSPEKYAMTCGLETMNLEPLYESIELLKASGIDYEFRTTVVEELHALSDFPKIGEMVRGGKAYYLQAFKDRDTVLYGNFHTPTEKCMKEYLLAVQQFVPNTMLRGI